MLRIEIREKACRGCELCIDTCPTDVLTLDQSSRKSRVERVENCIACLSCTYICPSGAIVHHDFHQVKNFYRDLGFCDRMERFL